MSRADFERRVLSAAAQLSDADGAEARRWYRDEPIAFLGGSTALELVDAGQGERVLAFLMDVLRDEAMPGHPSPG